MVVNDLLLRINSSEYIELYRRKENIWNGEASLVPMKYIFSEIEHIYMCWSTELQTEVFSIRLMED